MTTLSSTAIGAATRARLDSLYRGEPQPGTDGALYPIDTITRISHEAGQWLHATVLEERPRFTFEIGMAYGFSTLHILDALAQLGAGHHWACDPGQTNYWHGIGLANVERARTGDRLSFIERTSAATVPLLAEAGLHFDLVFVDGAHTFDAVMLDFTLVAPRCAPGGLVILDDLWMPAIRRAVEFVETNRRDFTRVETPIASLAAFRRTGSDERPWDHFVDFSSAA